MNLQMNSLARLMDKLASKPTLKCVQGQKKPVTATLQKKLHSGGTSKHSSEKHSSSKTSSRKDKDAKKKPKSHKHK